MTTPFETDIRGQADALRDFSVAHALSAAASELLQATYDRIVLTGMGSSHSAAVPTWRRLVAAGRPAWWVDAGQLLDAPDLVTPGTLLVVTSQSGASGEVTALASGSGIPRPRAVLGITNDLDSPLARASDAVIALHSGDEATVSTKSYLNTLAAHQALVAAMTGGSTPADALGAAVRLLGELELEAQVTELVDSFGAAVEPRLAYVGSADHAASALYAGLITKEAAKVAAEGYIGGQFRHGPLELAGPGLIAVLFGARTPSPQGAGSSLEDLARELVAAGSDVTLVGDLRVPGARTVALPRTAVLAELAAEALVAQHTAVRIARHRGIEPGAFSYGRKITTSL